MKTVARFHEMLRTMGSNVAFHREIGGEECECLTPEGFRDPAWHVANPDARVCNEQGMLVTAVEFVVKASVQPAVGGQHGLTRHSQQSDALLGSVQKDDKIGIFPCRWNNHVLNFQGWSQAGNDYILYDGDRYLVVAWDKLPDVDGDPNHHIEAGLRLVTPEDERV